MTVWTSAHGARKPLLFAVAVLTILGAWSCLVAPQSIFPPIAFARVEVFAYAGDLPPEEIRAAVTQPLEAALHALPVLRTRSYSNQGAVEIELDFDPGADMRSALHDVDVAIAAIRPSLRAVTRIETIIEHPNMEPIVTYALSGTTTSQARLRQLIEQRVATVFMGVPGLGRITVFGGPGIEYRVAIDPAALADSGTSAGAVARSIAEANSVHAAGTIDRAEQSEVVLVGEGLHDEAALAAVAIANRKTGGMAKLGDLAHIALGEGPATTQASFAAAHAVMLNAYSTIGADAVSLQREVEARIPQLLDGIPSDVRATRYWDQTRLIVASQHSLRDAILIGALLALLVIHAFLRSMTMTLVAAITIPVAMAITILAIRCAGMSLNLMSLGGLAIAVGLIIDEVIVVIEAIARELASSPATPRLAAIVRATRRIAVPLLASTAANVVVFVPLGLLSDIPGYFFRALAITLGSALVVSVFLSLVVVPLLANTFLRAQSSQRAGLAGLERRYVRLLERILRHRKIVYLAAAAVLVATFAVFTRLESDFLPALEEGEFEIKYALEAGTSLAATDEIVTGLERLILADPAVEYVGRLTGVDTNGLVPTPQNAGTIRVALRQAGDEDFDDIAHRLREALAKAAPDTTFEFHQLLEDQINDLSGEPEPIQLIVSGPDQQTLISIAEALTERIAKVPGIVDAFDGVVEGSQTIRIAPKSGDASGMTVAALADALSAGIGGIVATTMRDGDGAVPVRVVLAAPPAAVALDALAIPTSDGVRPLEAAATLGEPTRASEVFERNGARILLVKAGIASANLSAVIAPIQAIVADTKLPPGYRVTIGGAYQAQQESFREFAFVLGVAVLLVFLVLLATFNSFWLPLIVLATIPLSPIGVALALWVTATPINVSSFMGLLLLVGIVVRNGILLIDGANRRRAEGATIGEALLGAGTERLRPILMTTFAAIGALLPLAFGIGSGSEMQRPLAIAVIGGLSTATAFTLVVIPVLYASFSRVGYSRAAPAPTGRPA